LNEEALSLGSIAEETKDVVTSGSPDFVHKPLSTTEEQVTP
jgi:hypothetical protein